MALTSIVLMCATLLGQIVLVGSLYFIARYGRGWVERVVSEAIGKQDERIRKRVERAPRTEPGPDVDISVGSGNGGLRFEIGQPVRRR